MSKRSGVLFIGFLAVAAIGVVVVLNRNAPDEPITETNANQAVVEPITEPVVAKDGSYTVLQSTDTIVVGEITTYSFGEVNSLSVMPAAMQQAVLNETPTLNETDIAVAGVPGKKFTLSSAKDGSPFSVVQVMVNDQLFDFRGTDLFLDTLSQYIQFNQVK